MLCSSSKAFLQALNNKVVGYESDLWALGCVIYQMLHGTPPFRAASEYLIFQKVAACEYTMQHSFSEASKDVIRSLLQLEPISRLGKTPTRKEEGGKSSDRKARDGERGQRANPSLCMKCYLENSGAPVCLVCQNMFSRRLICILDMAEILLAQAEVVLCCRCRRVGGAPEPSFL